MASYRINGRIIKAVWTHSDTTAWFCLKSDAGRSLIIMGANNAAPRLDALLIAYAEPAD